MKIMVHTSLLAALLVLAGCGQMGPLYFDEDPPAALVADSEIGHFPADMKDIGCGQCSGREEKYGDPDRPVLFLVGKARHRSGSGGAASISKADSTGQ